MDPIERHEEAVQKRNRTRLLVFLLCLTLAVLLSALFLFFACRYSGTDFSIVLKEVPTSIVKDGFLYPAEQADAVYSYHLNTGELKEYPLRTLELNDFIPLKPLGKGDLEVSVTYFVYENSKVESGEETLTEKRICLAQPDLAPLNRANDDAHFVYPLADGRKLLIDLNNHSARPLFSGSVDGVDEFAANVCEFSYLGGNVAAGIESGDTLYLYRRAKDSFAISDFDIVDLSSYGSAFTLFFCNERYLQLTGTSEDGRPVYLVCDALNGEIRRSPLDESKSYDDTLYQTPYGRAYLFETADTSKTPLTLTALNVSVGGESRFKFADTVAAAQMKALSTTGAYGVFLTFEKSEEADNGLIQSDCTVNKANGKQVSLSSCVGEGEQFASAAFLSDTILLLEVSDAHGYSSQKIVKICF